MDGVLYGHGFGDNVILPQNSLDFGANTDSLAYNDVSGENNMKLYIQSDIIAKTQIANRVTQDLVKKYHAHFTELFNSARKHIDTLEEKIYQFENPLNKYVGNLKAVEFNPEPITVSEDIKNYIMEAMSKGVNLRDVLPSDFNLSI